MVMMYDCIHTHLVECGGMFQDKRTGAISSILIQAHRRLMRVGQHIAELAHILGQLCLCVCVYILSFLFSLSKVSKSVYAQWLYNHKGVHNTPRCPTAPPNIPPQSPTVPLLLVVAAPVIAHTTLLLLPYAPDSGSAPACLFAAAET